eukprot:evm.model.NODE_37535_length_24537_cov_23.534824.7
MPTHSPLFFSLPSSFSLSLPPSLPQNSIPEQIGREIEKAAKGIFPLSVVYVRKVKVLKKPKFDLVKLMEIHEGQTPVDDTGAGIDRPEEPALVPEVAGSGGRL